MSKKIIKILLPLLVLFFSSCQLPFKVPDVPKVDQNTLTDLLNSSGTDYVSEMTTDPDGFVRFPGEPTRESTDYYIIEDICGQFTGKFMEGVTGKTIIKTDDPYQDLGNIYACHYYFDGNTSEVASLYLVLDYLNVADQKKGLEFLDRKLETSTDIPMEHFIAIQEDGNINGIYFVLGPDKFIRLDRSSTTSATNEEMRAYATKIAQKIKNYK
jgi:hypothetical protein